MRLKGIMFALIILSLSAFTKEHALKMTFSKLIISSNGNVDLETRIFLDDLTAHMQKLYDLQQTDFSTTTSNGTMALRQYLKNHLYFKQGEKKINLYINSVSLSKNRLALVVNMSTTNKLDVSEELFLINTILCDASLMQTNDIKFLDKHHILSISNPKVKIEIN
ncbi:DUF6702 family protein [Winogradskyella sp. PG-2]|uniref:DUF6702 family protein n=1 Tax=Winogradskyella sp. PG-2 TaxID=754409 RepID=UPI00045898DC|nr:DUF6702 family protein [Winogradskyella sp. PG-2]BAO77033.1 hypothetical protein WPG_2803 [Winogradskyella sp. PG-2]